MLTKPLISGQGFRLSRDLFDDAFVYVEFSKVHFEASPDAVRVRIPIEIWETIRHHGGPDLSLLELSETDVRAQVEAAVDARIHAHMRGDPSVRFGDRTFGNVERSREEQIAAGMTAYKEELHKLQRLACAIEQLKRRS